MHTLMLLIFQHVVLANSVLIRCMLVCTRMALGGSYSTLRDCTAVHVQDSLTGLEDRSSSCQELYNSITAHKYMEAHFPYTFYHRDIHFRRNV